MPLANCFLEIQSDCFVAVQPFRDGEYESCRIYFEEIEGMIEGKKGTGFYVRISGEGRSVVQRKEGGRVMLVCITWRYSHFPLHNLKQLQKGSFFCRI